MLWLALLALGLAAPDDDAAYEGLRAHAAAMRDAMFAPPPAMPVNLAVEGLSQWVARDAVLMQRVEQDGSQHALLVVSDLTHVDEALLSGDLRGGTLLVVELSSGARANDDAPTQAFNLNPVDATDDRARVGRGNLQRFAADTCRTDGAHLTASGYVRLGASRDPQFWMATFNLGWGTGETLQGQVAVRNVAWMAHLHGTQALACSAAYIH